MEKGILDPNPADIVRLALLFNVTTDYLLGLSTSDCRGWIKLEDENDPTPNPAAKPRPPRRAPAAKLEAKPETKKPEPKTVLVRSIARTPGNRASYKEIWLTENEAEALEEKLENSPKPGPEELD